MSGQSNGKAPQQPTLVQQFAMKKHGELLGKLIGERKNEFIAAYGSIEINPGLMLIAVALADRCDALEGRLREAEGFIADMREAAAEYASKGDAS